jgi:hypothetical protein
MNLSMFSFVFFFFNCFCILFYSFNSLLRYTVVALRLSPLTSVQRLACYMKFDSSTS